RAVLLHALQRVAEMVLPIVDGLPQKPLQAVPGREHLRQLPFTDNPAFRIQRDALLDRDTEIAGAGAALLQRFQQLRWRLDSGAAADELAGGAFVDGRVPAVLSQERGRRRARTSSRQ